MAAWLKMSSLLERLATLLTPHLKRGGFDPRNPPAGYATGKDDPELEKVN